MKLSENYRIEVSKLNFTLQEYKEVTANRDTSKNKAGDIYYEWVNHGHHVSMKSALRGYINRFIDKSGTIEELINRIEILEGAV